MKLALITHKLKESITAQLTYTGNSSVKYIENVFLLAGASQLNNSCTIRDFSCFRFTYRQKMFWIFLSTANNKIHNKKKLYGNFFTKQTKYN